MIVYHTKRPSIFEWPSAKNKMHQKALDDAYSSYLQEYNRLMHTGETHLGSHNAAMAHGCLCATVYLKFACEGIYYGNGE